MTSNDPTLGDPFVVRQAKRGEETATRILEQNPRLISSGLPPLPNLSDLSPKQRRLLVSQRRQLIREKAKAQSNAIEVPDTKHKGFFWLLDQLDRPRNAFHNTMLSYMGGERDVDDLWTRFTAGLSGKERTNFEDILEEYGLEAQKVLFYPFMQMGVELETMQKIAGFGGDVLLDPINLIPGAAVAKALKGAGKGLQVAGKVTGLGDPLTRLGRSTFVRSTGLPALDKIIADKAVDLKSYNQMGLEKEAFELGRDFIRPMDKTLREHLIPLAEETRPGEVIDMMKQFLGEDLTRAQAEKIIRFGSSKKFRKGEGLGNFRNPDSFNRVFSRLKKLDDVERAKQFDLVQKAVLGNADEGRLGLRGFFDKLEELERASGKTRSTLGGQLIQNLGDLDTAWSRWIKKKVAKHADATLQKKKFANTTKKQRGAILKALVGKEGTKRLLDSITSTITPDDAFKLAQQGKLTDPTDFMAIMQDFMADAAPEIIPKLRGDAGDMTAAQNLFREFSDDVLGKIGDMETPFATAAKRDRILDNMAKTPSYVPHVGTAAMVEALHAVGDLPTSARGLLRSPAHAADIARKYAIEGRPLSLNEIERITRKDQIDLLKSAADPDIPITIDTKMGHMVAHGTPLKESKVFGTARELAKPFEVDPALIMATGAQRTARATSVAETLQEAARVFGKLPEELTAKQLKAFEPLSNTTGGAKLVQMVPALEKRLFQPEHAAAIVRMADRYLAPQQVLKYYDTMMHWWKSYTLPLFLGFHSRNAIGNLFNMSYTGFLSPKSFAGDVADSIKTTRLQMLVARGNVEDAKKLKFFVKSLGKEVDGMEFLDMSLRHGIGNTGLFAGEIGHRNRAYFDSRYRNPGTWIPGSTDFIAVQGGRALGEGVENNARMVLFANRLKKGDDIRTASGTVKKHLGDYRNEVMNPFERDIMARVFPFMRWSRFNIPLQFESLLTNNTARRRIMGTLRGAQAIAPEGLGPEQIPEEIPAWIRESAGVPVKRNQETGELEFLLVENFIPAADIDNFLGFRSLQRFMVNQAGFAFTKPVEFATGRSIFLDRELRGKKSEFLGKVLDSELVSTLRTLRVLAELDRMDPFGSFHKVRSQASLRNKVQRQLGVTTFQINPARAQIGFNQELLEKLRQESALIRAQNEAMRKEDPGAEWLEYVNGVEPPGERK